MGIYVRVLVDASKYMLNTKVIRSGTIPTNNRLVTPVHLFDWNISKIEHLACVQTDRQTDTTESTFDMF